MLEQRHNTHALSSLSSSNNHSYDNGKKSKNMKSILQLDLKEKIDNVKLYNDKLDKINDILNKYNIISDRNQNREEKIFSKLKKKVTNNEYIKKKKNVQIKNEINGNTSSISISILNANSNNNNFLINNYNKENKNSKNSKNSKDKTESKIEEQKNNNDSLFFTKYTETSRSINKKKELISYKNNSKETRFNNIQNNLEEEKKTQQRKMGNKKNKLLFYQQMNNSRNLLRVIKKPEISFITKISKTSYTLSGIRFSVRNDLCFYTKKIMDEEENSKIERRFKLEKYEKLKKEVEAEKIPTFSSIDSSSSENSLTRIKIKSKGKSKSKFKKKKSNHKSKQKLSSPKRKKLVLPKYNRPIRSISVHSKFSNESNRTFKLNLKKNNNMNNNTNNANKIARKNNQRKFSIITRLQEKFLNKRQTPTKNNFISSKDLRSVENNKTPFINNNNTNNNNNINSNNNNNNNNLLDINKQTEENIQDKDKQNSEKDFKKFLEEQKIKKKIQIMNFIKKQGMTSYNFFYPKEPSPLLSVFKNKYSVYPTLNTNRRSSLEREKEKLIKEKNKTDFFYSATYRYEKINLKKLRQEQEREKNNENSRNNKNTKNKEIIKLIHIKEKHYGNEKDCPICRLAKLKREKEKSDTENLKLMKYNRFLPSLLQGGLSPIHQPRKIKLIREFEPIMKNRINSARDDLIGVYQQERKNFNVLIDYLMQ